MTCTLVSLDRITHIHSVRTSRDCDGRYDNDSIISPRPGETARDAWAWWVTADVDVPGAEVTRTTTEDGYPQVEMYRRTDEGFEHEILTGCDDECDPRTRRYRDYTAEAAGY